MTTNRFPESAYSLPTRLIYGEHESHSWEFGDHVIPPITTSSAFRLRSAERGASGFLQFGKVAPSEGDYDPIYIYDRLGEPNVDMLQHALATAEGGECAVTFGTGMGAIAGALLTVLKSGDEVISHQTIYGCTWSLFDRWFPRLGITVKKLNLMSPDCLLASLTPKTRVIYFESLSNPTLELLDLPAIAESVTAVNEQRDEETKIKIVVDNTFPTPFCYRPLLHGADMVIHSLTKGICGFGTEMGGAVITSNELYESLRMVRKDFGGSLSPHTAWHLLTYGLSTLPMRMRHQQQSAHAVAAWLQAHPLIEEVRYPGLPSFEQHTLAQTLLRDFDGNMAPGSMIYFRIKGSSPAESRMRGEKMMNFIATNAYTVTLAVSLGQIRTLIEHPASMTHAPIPPLEQVAAGIDTGGIRLSIGIESPSDLIRDIGAALDAAK